MGDVQRERRFSSRSTASRMKSERFSPSANAASIRASVPSRNRAGVCSPLILGRPTGAEVADITFFAKSNILLISPIDCVTDITYKCRYQARRYQMTQTIELLRSEYEAAYATVLARHEANENVSLEEQTRLGSAEMALTDAEIANGTFKGWA